MADGPRCQRRKQANPQRNNMTNYSNVAEASSDSDDEDKLHIVEEDSIPDGSDCHTSVPAQNPSVFQQNGATELHNGHTELGSSMGPDAMIQEVTIKVKEECVSEDDDEDRQEQGDAAGAQAPEDEQSTPERAVHDENGTPEFLQLHTCPYCSRGYKRYSSLKEHIKYRHEKSDDNYSCSLCTYTFSHRTQLDRHMTAHKGGREQRVVTQSGGNRKFSCSECSKAFKYKHHLKEHLRIHSGEKPYECSNCKKRFSHSGSYSSHISSKKCVGAPPMVNGLPHSTGGKSVSASAQNSNSGPVENPPTRILLREKVEPSKPLQEQLPITQIKQEPTEHQQKPLITTASTVATTTTTTTPNGGVAAVQVATNQGVVQTLVLPTVGLVQPISINLSDLQNVLKLAMEGNVRQGLAISNVNGGCAKLVGQVQSKTQTVFAVQAQQPQAAQLISAISLPVVDQDGTAKIIINYSMDPQLGAAKANPTQPNTVHPQPIQPTTALAQTKETQVNLKQPGQTKVVLAQATPVQSIVTQSKQTQPNKTQLMLAHSNIGQPIRLVQTVSGPSRLAQPTVFIVQRRVEPATQPSVPTQQAVEAKAGAEPDRTDRPKLSTEVACEPEDLTKPVRIKTEPASPPPPDVETEPEKGKDKLINGGQVGRTDGEIETEKTSPASDLQVVQSGSASGDRPTCLLCDEQPGGLDILHSTSRCAHNDGRDTNGSESVSLSSLLGKEEEAGGAGCPSLESLLALLKAYNQDTEPSEEELTNVAQSVGLPLNVVRRWYQRMRSGQASPQPSGCANQSQQVNVNGAQVDSSSGSEVRICQPENLSALAETHTCTSTGAKAGVPSQPDSPSAPSSSPLNLSATGLVIVKTEDSDGEGQDEPLDLSLPKPPHEANVPVTTTTQAEPLNLTCVQKEPSPGNTIYVTQPNAGPINIVATPLPTLVAIAEPSGVPCLRAISTQKRTILIPQLTYTYTTTSDGSSAANTPNTVILNSCQEEKVDTSSEGVSAVEEQNDSDSSPVRKRRRTQGGKYACDLCDKIFQKSSSLLRHKYEHTGRRPHECGICNKAFKHKHHLIEHTRLHSGEKPYQCDKCGKRFSHSGSYSQHMNHRYSYCKKEAQNRTDLNTSPAPPSQLDSDERESEEEDEEEERDQEGGEEDLSILDMDDIRVVRVGEEGSEGYGEELEEEDDGGMSEEQEHGGGGEEQAVIEGEEVMEVYLGDSHPPGEVGETTVMESTMEVVEGSGENVGMTEERNVTDSLENIETAKEGKTIG